MTNKEQFRSVTGCSFALLRGWNVPNTVGVPSSTWTFVNVVLEHGDYGSMVHTSTRRPLDMDLTTGQYHHTIPQHSVRVVACKLVSTVCSSLIPRGVPMLRVRESDQPTDPRRARPRQATVRPSGVGCARGVGGPLSEGVALGARDYVRSRARDLLKHSQLRRHDVHRMCQGDKAAQHAAALATTRTCVGVHGWAWRASTLFTHA